MNTDFSGYTFTNGTKVTDWLASIPADDRDRAAKVVKEFVAARKPLNMLQVKIRLAAPPAETNTDYDDISKRPVSVTSPAEETMSARINDAYNSPGPIRPTVETVTPVMPSDKSRKLTINKLVLIIVAVILAIAVFTNPSRETHVRMLTESVARATARSIGQDMDMDMFGGMFGFGQPRITEEAIGSLVYEVLDTQLEYHNYILFSTCSAKVGYNDHTVSIGAFGMVIATEDNLTIN